jgi:hypothetical protein
MYFAALVLGTFCGNPAGENLTVAASNRVQGSQGATEAAGPTQSVVDALKKGGTDVINRLGPAAFDPLVSALKHEEAEVRSKAAFHLGLLGDPRALEFIIPLLKDVEYTVRAEAAGALGRLGDQRARLLA